MTKYIVEARSTFGQPSLYAFDSKLMVEVDRSKAMRMTHEQAKIRAQAEKRLRPGRRVLVIAVES